MGSNKIFGLSAIVALLVSFMALFYINLQSHKTINRIENEIKTVTSQQQGTQVQISKLESDYNADEIRAKTVLASFSSIYFTYQDQASYTKRLEQVASILAISDTNKQVLFDSGLDDTGGSKIDNLGLQSNYIRSTSYVSNNQQGVIEVLSNVQVRTRTSMQGSTDTTVLVQGFYDVQRQQLTTVNTYSLN